MRDVVEETQYICLVARSLHLFIHHCNSEVYVGVFLCAPVCVFRVRACVGLAVCVYGVCMRACVRACMHACVCVCVFKICVCMSYWSPSKSTY